MNCEFCDGATSPRKVKRQHWLRGKLYIVENVAAEVCSECGERFFDAKVLDEIDSVLSADHDVEEQMLVEVISL